MTHNPGNRPRMAAAAPTGPTDGTVHQTAYSGSQGGDPATSSDGATNADARPRLLQILANTARVRVEHDAMAIAVRTLTEGGDQLLNELAEARGTIAALDAVCARIAAATAGVRITERLTLDQRTAYLSAIGRHVDRRELAETEPCEDGPGLTVDDFEWPAVDRTPDRTNREVS